MARIAWIDTAKAMLLYLVVLGHLHYVYAPLPLKEVIYAFHLPAFLVVTGLLLPPEFGALPPQVVWRKWGLFLLRAYLMVSALSIAIWWGAASLKQGAVASPLGAILGMAYGVAGSENGLVHHNPPLWYFPFLISALALAYLALRLPRLWGAAVLIFAVAAGEFWQGPRLPWSLEVAGLGAVAIWTGVRLRQVWLAATQRRHARWLVPLAGGILLGAVWANGDANLNGASHGRSLVLYALGAGAGTAMIFGLAALLPPLTLARRLSEESLSIFALHFYGVILVGRLLPQVADAGMRAVLMSVGAAVVLLGTLCVARVLRPVVDPLVHRRGFSVEMPAE